MLPLIKLKGCVKLVYLVFFLSIVCFTLIDQLLKVLAKAALEGGNVIQIIGDVFVLKYTENTGGAFSFLSSNTIALIIFSIIMIAVVIVLFFKVAKITNPFAVMAVTFIIAGGISNNIDRIARGYVVDYLYFTPIDFPIFNFADILVVCGCIFLAIFIFFIYKEPEKTTKLGEKNGE